MPDTHSKGWEQRRKPREGLYNKIDIVLQQPILCGKFRVVFCRIYRYFYFNQLNFKGGCSYKINLTDIVSS